MIIDWFIVVAQIINFIILVFLLKVFLYRPVFEAIGRRKNEIENSIAQAKEKESAAEMLLEEYEKMKSSLESKEKKIIDDAHVAAAEYLKERNLQLDAEIEGLKIKKIEKIKKDEKNFQKYAAETFTKLIFDVSHRVIEELSGQNLEALMFERFLKYLETELPNIEGEVNEHCEVNLSTAFELSPEQQNNFKTLTDKVLKNACYKFHVKKENLIGINLLVDTYEISWNASTALTSIEKNISDSIHRAEFLR